MRPGDGPRSNDGCPRGQHVRSSPTTQKGHDVGRGISVRERHRCRRSVTRSVTNTSASGVSPNAARGRSLAPVAAPWRDPSIRADRRYPIRRRPTYRTKLYPSKNMVWRYIAAALGYNSRHGNGARRKPAGPIPRKIQDNGIILRHRTIHMTFKSHHGCLHDFRIGRFSGRHVRKCVSSTDTTVLLKNYTLLQQ
jgi:hypothetical protein